MQPPLVELIEDDRTHALQGVVVMQHAGQDTFGDHLNARARRCLVFKADTISHRFADLFAQERCHAACDAAGRQATGFEHNDLTSLQPRFIQQGEWYDSALSRSCR